MKFITRHMRFIRNITLDRAKRKKILVKQFIKARRVRNETERKVKTNSYDTALPCFLTPIVHVLVVETLQYPMAEML
jgi:hypothetical protein